MQQSALLNNSNKKIIKNSLFQILTQKHIKWIKNKCIQTKYVTHNIYRIEIVKKDYCILQYKLATPSQFTFTNNKQYRSTFGNNTDPTLYPVEATHPVWNRANSSVRPATQTNQTLHTPATVSNSHFVVRSLKSVVRSLQFLVRHRTITQRVFRNRKTGIRKLRFNLITIFLFVISTTVATGSGPVQFSIWLCELQLQT